MEHRKFKHRPSELVGDLTAAQARKLSERGAGTEAQQLIDGRFRTDLKCPHCAARHIHRGQSPYAPRTEPKKKLTMEPITKKLAKVDRATDRSNPRSTYFLFDNKINVIPNNANANVPIIVFL
jgi:hypothetical protein